VFIVFALRGLKATIIFVEHNENVEKKRAAKMPHPNNEIFGISICLLVLVVVVVPASDLTPYYRPIPFRIYLNLREHV
jgi:hypothetical protein